MKTKKTKETFWAVRIGNHRHHSPYFMLGPDNRTPALFDHQGLACMEAAKITSAKAVQVRLIEQ